MYILTLDPRVAHALPRVTRAPRHVMCPRQGMWRLAYVRDFAEEKVLHTFRVGKSGMVLVAKLQFLPKNTLDKAPSTP